MSEYNKITLTKEQFKKLTHLGENFRCLVYGVDLQEIGFDKNIIEEFMKEVEDFKEIIKSSGMSKKEIQTIQEYYYNQHNDSDNLDMSFTIIRFFEIDRKIVTYNEYLDIIQKLKILKKPLKDFSEEEKLFFQKIKERFNFYSTKTPSDYLIFVVENNNYVSIDCVEIINLIKEVHTNFANWNNYLEAKKKVEDFENECK